MWAKRRNQSSGAIDVTMPPVRVRGLSLIAVTSMVLLTAGCAGDGGPGATRGVGNAGTGDGSAQPTASGTGAAPAHSAGPSVTAGGRSTGPGVTRTTAGASPPGSVARLCTMADLRFWLSLATPNAGPHGSGSVQMTNTAADRCRLSGYITVRWLDSSGAQMSITVEHLPGSMPAYTSVLQPGRSAFAGLEWTRSRALPSDPDVPCPPVPGAIEARLSTATGFAHMAWTPRDGLCDSKAGIRPIETTP